MKFPARHFAARFAAKEAVSKAFGTGIGRAMGWKDIDVHRKPSGEPFVVLERGAKVLLGEGGGVWSILITPNQHQPKAMVVIVMGNTPRARAF